jgi:hypothetical protein
MCASARCVIHPARLQRLTACTTVSDTPILAYRATPDSRGACPCSKHACLMHAVPSPLPFLFWWLLARLVRTPIQTHTFCWWGTSCSVWLHCHFWLVEVGRSPNAGMGLYVVVGGG